MAKRRSKIVKVFKAAKTESTLLVLYIPSVDRAHRPIDQDYSVKEALTMLGYCFGGATAFPKARGVWCDDARGVLVFDEPVVIQCYTSDTLLEENATELHEFLLKMGRETRQGAVGLVIDRDYLEIQFPPEESSNGKEHS